ncbi:spherulation-specific family 4 protein [Streptacidiphilus monticola]|uniref:Spherulation-specific family 4 protein n=1 Tax=Streptacidiphilus monticola TaxID=2161674 RepID=A0ABW1G0I0_9ACTN
MLLFAPAYVYPATDPGFWDALVSAPDRLAGVVLNPASGVGGAPDPVWEAAAEKVAAAGVPCYGYVDTAYATRAHADVVAEVAAYRRWYRVEGVFFDQVSSGDRELPYFRRLGVAARELGAARLALNPGVHPQPGYAGLADVLVTFEGSQEEYGALQVPPWVREFPAERFCHLVYGATAPVGATALARHAALSWSAPGGLPNPWQGACH